MTIGCRLVGDPALDRPLELAPGDVERAGDGALLVLLGLADVEHHGAGTLPARHRRRRCRPRGSRPWWRRGALGSWASLVILRVRGRLKTLPGWSTIRPAAGFPPPSAGSTSPIDPWITTSARSSIAVGVPLTMTTSAPDAAASGTTSAIGVDAQRRADREQQVAGTGGRVGPAEVGGDEALPEADRGRLEDPAAAAAGRVVLAGPHPIERPPPSGPVAARQAHGLSHRAVHLHHEVGVGARREVEPVDVLRDEARQPTGALEVDERPGGRRSGAAPQVGESIRFRHARAAPRGRPGSGRCGPPSRPPGPSSRRRSGRGSRGSRCRC